MKRYLGQINIVRNDPSKKKSFLKMVREIVVLAITRRELPLYYGGKFLYRDDIKNYKDYLSMKQANKIAYSKKYHAPEYISFLKNKLAFSFYFEKMGVPVPKLVSYNMAQEFVLGDEEFHIDSKMELKAFFEKSLDRSARKQLFIKPLAEHGGTGCQLLYPNNIDAVMDALMPGILHGGFIHQERVEQHHQINEIYSHSLNTIRMETYIDTNGKVHLLSSYIRFGSGGKFVDNNSSGGFYVSIDLETGRLRGKGRQKMKSGAGGRLFFEHPDTHFPLQDFKVPHFKKACALVINSVSLIPSRYIGWDVAISENGPVLIEGNGHSAIKTADIAYGGYLKNEQVREMLKNA